MYPHERSLVKELKDRPFALIGVNSDADLEELREIRTQKELTWRSFWNGPRGTGGPISAAWGVRVWPTVYVLDAGGRIRFVNTRTEQAMSAAIEQLLEEMR